MSTARAETIADLRALRAHLDRTIERLEKGGTLPREEVSAETPPDAGLAEPFVGRLIRSKYSGRCLVCGEAYHIDEQVLYSRELRRSAHPRCGRVTP